jgi:excisionase family DNA binding protein
MAMEKTTLTSGQVARLLGISPRTARRYLTQGRIPAEQNPLTGRWRVTREALLAFMHEHNLLLGIARGLESTDTNGIAAAEAHAERHDA